jgi:hypothetical protein
MIEINDQDCQTDEKPSIEMHVQTDPLPTRIGMS